MSPEAIQSAIITAIIVTIVGALLSLVTYGFRKVIGMPSLYATKHELERRYIDMQMERSDDLKALSERRNEDLIIFREINRKLDEMYEVITQYGALGAKVERLEIDVGRDNNSGLRGAVHKQSQVIQRLGLEIETIKAGVR